VLNKGLLICALITISSSLSLSQYSNHVCRHYIMTCALIASLRPLMKHCLKNKSDWPAVQIVNFSKVVIYSIIVPIWCIFFKNPNYECHVQNEQKIFA
jgi:hypothetical protein